MLIYDKVQTSNAPAALKSGALADKYKAATSFTIAFDQTEAVNCIGIGYTDATEVILTGSGLFETITVGSSPNANGLYIFSTVNVQTIAISHNGSYIGRIAFGIYRSLGVAPTREAGFYTTQADRETLSGQQIDSAGGYNGRRVSVSLRYKIDADAFTDIQTAYPYIAKALPFFLAFSTAEQNWIPWPRLYAKISDNNILFQSSVNRLLYSRNFDFIERF